MEFSYNSWYMKLGLALVLLLAVASYFMISLNAISSLLVHSYGNVRHLFSAFAVAPFANRLSPGSSRTKYSQGSATGASGSSKAQSAMEYLMTYGWAILVIAVVMVALFALGILGGGTPFGTTCLAQSGYVCSNPIFSSNTGALTATLGQASGTSWATANFVFVPGGTSTANPNALFGATNSFQLGTGLATEQQASVTLAVNTICKAAATGTCATSTGPAVVPQYAVGTTVQGTIWAQYTLSGSATYYYAKMATVTAKAA